MTMRTFEIEEKPNRQITVDHPFAHVKEYSCSGFSGDYVVCKCSSLEHAVGELYDDGKIDAPRVILRGCVGLRGIMKSFARYLAGCDDPGRCVKYKNSE